MFFGKSLGEGESARERGWKYVFRRGKNRSHLFYIIGADASKSRRRRAAASGWSTRLACCLRRLAADTRCACVPERCLDLDVHLKRRGAEKERGATQRNAEKIPLRASPFPSAPLRLKKGPEASHDANRHEVFPAGRREQHASRVLHPSVALRRQRNFDASAVSGVIETGFSATQAKGLKQPSPGQATQERSPGLPGEEWQSPNGARQIPESGARCPAPLGLEPHFSQPRAALVPA